MAGELEELERLELEFELAELEKMSGGDKPISQPAPTQPQEFDLSTINPMKDISIYGVTGEDVMGGLNLAQNIAMDIPGKMVGGLVAMPEILTGEGLKAAETAKQAATTVQPPLNEEGQMVAGKIGESLKNIASIPGIDSIIKGANNATDLITKLFESTGSVLSGDISAPIKSVLDIPQTPGSKAEMFSNVAGSVGQALPGTALDISGFRGAPKGIIKDLSRSRIPQKASPLDAVKKAESETGIRQLTTDALPPQSRVGGFMQQQGELVAPGARQAQQAERVTAIKNTLEKFDVSDGQRFESNIVDSVKRSISKQKSKAGELYEASSKQLNKFGDLPISRSRQFAERVIKQQMKRGSLADNQLITSMQKFVDAPDNLDFTTVKAIRSKVGADLASARSGAPVVGTTDTGILSQMYSRLTNDMKAFAGKADPELAKKWREADKVFSDFATGANKTGVKSLIKRGDSTPEIVDQLLFSTKKSDQNFLAANLDKTGSKAAKQRVIQRIMQKSSPDGDEINPNRFATQMTKMRNQIDRFFPADERKAMIMLRDSLNKTRRAQDAKVTTATGQQLVPLFALSNPVVLIPGVAQAMIEKPLLRNMLLKRRAVKTTKQRQLIDQRIMDELNKLGLLAASTKNIQEANNE